MLRVNGRKVLVLSEVYESVPVVLPGWFEDAKQDELEGLRTGIQALLNPPEYLSFMTINETAADLGWSPSKVRKAIAGNLAGEYAVAGPLPTIRLGRRVLIQRSAMEAWMDRLLEHETKN